MEAVSACARQVLEMDYYSHPNLTEYRRFTDGQIIAVKLEDVEETFLVQKAVLTSASSYFIAALEGEFKESTESTLKLPGCTKETFELFLFWICHRELPGLWEWLDKGDSAAKTYQQTAGRAQTAFVRLWCFADAYLMPKLQNAAMILLLECLENSRTNAGAAKLALELTSSGSPVRDAVMDELVSDYTRGPKGERDDRYSEEEMDTLGATPGFMSELTTRLFSVGVERYSGVCGRESGHYMVNEEDG